MYDRDIRGQAYKVAAMFFTSPIVDVTIGKKA